MPTMNLRQLRDTKQLKLWLKAGETVELRDRFKVFARIVPEGPEVAPEKEPEQWPDFEARRRAIFGDRVLPAVEQLLEDRENSRYGISMPTAVSSWLTTCRTLTRLK
jgi:antitoxin (DNA-binding transcriptional repressor) of toxin-antitoxin stability system